MGKKSKKPDVRALFDAGTCARCAKRDRLAGGVWCKKCLENGQRTRHSRRKVGKVFRGEHVRIHFGELPKGEKALNETLDTYEKLLEEP